MIRTKTNLIAVFLLCAVVAHVYGGDISYSITDLGVIGNGPNSFPVGMNNLGEVVGYADTYTRYSHAFLYTGSGPLINLGSFGGDYSVSSAQAINDQGTVVGYSDTSAGGSPEHAFLYTGNGPIQDLGTLGGAASEALDINNSGQIVGVSQVAGGNDDGFLYSGNGPMVDLGPYRAILINDSGQVVANNGSAGSLHTYISSGGTGTWVDIGSLGGVETAPYGMNNRGAIVGLSTTTTASELFQAFLYSGGTMTDLGTFGGKSSCANGINDFGVVVGFAYLPGDLAADGFVYYGSGAIEDLNNLLVNPSPGWTINGASAINDSGQIAAWDYQEELGEVHTVLLTPTPEPSSFCLLIVGAFAFLAIKLRRFRTRVRGFS